MRRRHALALSALALAAALRAHAQDQRLLLDLCINGRCLGSSFVVLRDGHYLIDADALARADIPTGNVPATTIAGHRFVDIAALVHGARASMDAAGTRLDLTLPAEAWSAKQVAVNPAARRLPPASVPSVYANYAADIGSAGRSSLFLDGGWSRGVAVLRSTATWLQHGGWSRGLTRYEYDDLDHMRRWTAGDQFAFSGDGLGGTALIGGIGVSRAFDLDPYLITFPQPTISGVLQAPGTIDVYQNGVLVAQRAVGAGPFSLANLGLGPGSNDVRVVVHDPFGGTRELQQSFYGATAALAPGLSEYAFQLGVERPSQDSGRYDSGRPALLARQRWGLSDWLTAGYRIEAGRQLVNAGPSADIRLPVGYLHLALAASRADGAEGAGQAYAYDYVGRRFGFAAGVQLYSRDYRRLGDDFALARVRSQRYFNASWSPLERFTLQASIGDVAFADGTRQRSEGLSGSLRLGYGATLLLALTRSRTDRDPADTQAFANLVIPLGRGSIGVNAAHDDAGTSYGVSAQRSLPSDTGYGYALDASHGPDGLTGRAELDYQNAYARVAAIGTRFAGRSDGDLLVSGSLLALDGRVFAGRPLDGSYALVEVPGMAGVDITRENQTVGSTDQRGDVLVPGLLPYQANRIGLDQADVPAQYAVGSTAATVSVPRFGGTVVRFDVHPLQAVRGRLRLQDQAVRYGTLEMEVDGTVLRSPVGADGSFYFGDLAAGRYEARLHHEGAYARCALDVPASTAPIRNLGEVTCTPEPAP
ncbi:P pilus assembly protein porin PapC-like [Mizugakiibacter sediminis]|uniref:P pilus assembly protein porin PapC-like n=1 Tax=Mizugakiibacter sediminis TaxID=1475481 RepID=A0A0K8QP81_9GAMM|nr:fimbria/pilus outer membrane usher protein [Mizugakiibacter sediminis]GAP66688.1 P pilus assembly protein porin PapC-like [Mizugakiibacter sediminis]